mgnify:CR=1 FL=1
MIDHINNIIYIVCVIFIFGCWCYCRNSKDDSERRLNDELQVGYTEI